MVCQLRQIFNSPHFLPKFEIQKYYQNEHRFKGFYSRDNLPERIKDGTYVINLAEYMQMLLHIRLLNMYKMLKLLILKILEGNMFLLKLEKLLGIFRIERKNSICAYFCFAFIDFMFAGKTLIDYTNLFSLYHFEKIII